MGGGEVFAKFDENTGLPDFRVLRRGETGAQPDFLPVIVAKNHLHRAVERFEIECGKWRHQISRMNDQ